MSSLQLHPPPPLPPHEPPPLDARVWMPPFLFLLQMFAHSYADAPDPTLRKKYYQLLTDLHVALPDARWQMWYARSLDTLPVQAFLVDRHAVADWVHRLRSEVHLQLGWQPVSFSEHQEAFYRAFRPAPVRERIEATQHSMHFVLAAGLAVLLVLVYFLAPPLPAAAAAAVGPASTMQLLHQQQQVVQSAITDLAHETATTARDVFAAIVDTNNTATTPSDDVTTTNPCQIN